MTRSLPLLAPSDKALFIASARMLLTARKGKPVPWRHTGRNTKGIDCIGVPIWAYGQIGMASMIEDLDRYSRTPDGKTLRDSIRAHLGEPIPYAQAEPGDIALMRWHGNGGQFVNHVAVIVDYPYGGLALLHALESEEFGKVVSHRIDSKWRRRIFEVYRT